MAADPIVNYILTNHAVIELSRRGLEEQDIDAVLRNPAQRLDLRAVELSYNPNIRKVELNIC